MTQEQDDKKALLMMLRKPAANQAFYQRVFRERIPAAPPARIVEPDLVMRDFPKFGMMVGFRNKLVRKIFKLITSPKNNNSQIDQLLAILERRGKLSVLAGGRNLQAADTSQNSGDKT